MKTGIDLIVVLARTLERDQMAEIIRRVPHGTPLDYAFGPGFVRLKRQVVSPDAAAVLCDMGFQLWFTDSVQLALVDEELGERTVGHGWLPRGEVACD